MEGWRGLIYIWEEDWDGVVFIWEEGRQGLVFIWEGIEEGQVFITVTINMHGMVDVKKYHVAYEFGGEAEKKCPFSSAYL